MSGLFQWIDASALLITCYLIEAQNEDGCQVLRSLPVRWTERATCHCGDDDGARSSDSPRWFGKEEFAALDHQRREQRMRLLGSHRDPQRNQAVDS